MKEIVYLNGKFLEAKEANIPLVSPGFLCGIGLFETMRFLNKRTVYFDEHLNRIKNACKIIGLRFPFPLIRIKNIIKKTVEINGLPDAYLRLTLWESESGTGTSIIARKYKPYTLEKYKKGFSAKIAEFKQNDGCGLTQIKTTNRIIYELCLQDAKNYGFDEALFLNNRGLITETSRSNIFFAKNDAIFTPSLECGCLDGITRKVILDLARKYKIKAKEGNFTLQDLYYAEEAFLTNSLIGIMPLTSVEKQNIGKGRRGRLTDFFIKKYNLLLKNGT